MKKILLIIFLSLTTVSAEASKCHDFLIKIEVGDFNATLEKLEAVTMREHLLKKEKSEVYEGLTDLIQESFLLSREVCKEITEEILAGDRVSIVRDSRNEIIAVTSWEIKKGEKSNTAYLSLAAVSPKAQGKGLYSEINRQRLEDISDSGINRLSVRTQNPRVEATIWKTLRSMETDGVISQVGLEKRVYEPGFFGQMLTTEKPTVNDPVIQSSFNKLNYEAGDSYMIYFSFRNRD